MTTVTISVNTEQCCPFRVYRGSTVSS